MGSSYVPFASCSAPLERGIGTSRTLEPVTGDVAVRGRKANTRAWRHSLRYPANRRGPFPPPGLGCQSVPVTTHILHEAGSSRKPRAAPQGPVRSPGGGAGPESPRIGASHGRPLLIGQRRSRAVRPEIGNAPSQSRSNGTGDCTSQSRSPRGWDRSRTQSPGWEPGSSARTMPYLLISTQTRMVSTTARLIGVRAGPGPQGLWPHLGASLPGSPVGAGPKNRLGHAPSGHGEGGCDCTLSGSRDSKLWLAGASSAVKEPRCVCPRDPESSRRLRLLSTRGPSNDRDPGSPGLIRAISTDLHRPDPQRGKTVK